MLAIIVTHTIKPECIEKYQELVRELAQASRKEAGCLGYNSFQSDEDARVHTLVEQWESKEALDVHSKSAHFQQIVPQFKALFAEPERAQWQQIIA